MAEQEPTTTLRVILNNGEWVGLLSDFLRINEDGIDPDEVEAIWSNLFWHGSYVGGGGAAPEWRLEVKHGE